MNKKKLTLIISAFFLLTIIPLVSSTLLYISVDDNGGNTYPLDRFTIEIRDDSILRNVTMSYCFYDSDKGECIFEETEFVSRISEEYNWELIIDKNLSDLETKEYKINATINGTRNGKYFEIFRSKDVRMLIEDDLVVIKNLTETDDWNDYSVGDNVQFSSEIWDIGKNNQSNVFMRVYSDDLNLNETIILENISSMNKVDFSYSIEIQDDINFFGEEYLCPKVFFTLYNSSNVEFNKSDGEIIEEKEGFCIINPDYVDDNNPSAKISYQIIGKPEIGKETTIKFNITNNGEIPINGTIKMSDDSDWENHFTDWAVLQSISPPIFNLNPNQSMQVELKLIPNVYGIHSLEIALYDLNNSNFEQKGVYNIIIYDTTTNQTTVINNTIDSTEEINSLNEKINNLEDEIDSLDKKQTKKIKKLQQEIDELNEIINSLNNPEVSSSQPSTPAPIILNSSQEKITFLDRIINLLDKLFGKTQ